VTDTWFDSFDAQEQPQYLRDYLARAAASSDIARVRATGLARWNLGDGEQRLLDAGCGNGEVARDLAAMLPKAEVTAVDFSADAIAEATRLDHDGRVTYATADVCDLPFDQDHFDGVRTERVLQHLKDPDRAVAELTRVLRPGGRMCLIDTDFESLAVDGSPPGFNDAVRAMNALVGTRRSPEAIASGRILRRRMVQAGLTDVRAEPVVIVHTDLAEASQLLPLQRDNPLLRSVGDFDTMFDALEAAVADGTFLITFTMWVVVGTKPR